MAIEIVQRAGIKRKPGLLYFLRGVDVWAVPLGKGKARRITKGTYEREEGYLYFLDQRGDIARAPRHPMRVLLINRTTKALNLLRQCYTHVPAKLRKEIIAVLREPAREPALKKPRRKHSRSGQVKCPICAPCRCSLA